MVLIQTHTYSLDQIIADLVVGRAPAGHGPATTIQWAREVAESLSLRKAMALQTPYGPVEVAGDSAEALQWAVNKFDGPQAPED